ncbi:hypothetical protein KAH55_11190, partial [bacterium]|nr:hypothetical protein [bacterium]
QFSVVISIHRRIDEIISKTHVPFAKDWSWFCTTDEKIKVLKRVGVEYRAIVHLITDIRNKYEHKYELPPLDEIRAYLEVTDLWLERSIKRYSFNRARIINLPVSGVKADIETNGNLAIINEVVFDKTTKVIFFDDEKKQIIFIAPTGKRDFKAYSEYTISEILEIEKEYFKIVFDEKYQFEMIHRITDKNSCDLFNRYERWVLEKKIPKKSVAQFTLKNEEKTNETSTMPSKEKIAQDSLTKLEKPELLTVSGGDIDFKIPILPLDENYSKITEENSRFNNKWLKITK